MKTRKHQILIPLIFVISIAVMTVNIRTSASLMKSKLQGVHEELLIRRTANKL